MKIKVLLDVTCALHSYGGIPQDTRNLFKLISTNPNIELSLLIMGRRVEIFTWLPFIKNKIGLDYFNSILIESEENRNFIGKSFVLIKILVLALLQKKVKISKLEFSGLKECIWRNYFSQGLSGDKSKLENINVYSANTSTSILNLSSLLPIGAKKIDSDQFDYIIFIDSKKIKLGKSTKKVIRYYDAIPLLFPQFLKSKLTKIIHRNSLKYCLQDNSTLMFDSTSAKDDVQKLFGKIENSYVIPCAIQESFNGSRDELNIEEIILEKEFNKKKKKFNRFILSVSTIEIRKNYSTIFKAFDKIKEHHEMNDLGLVIVGSPGWKADNEISILMGERDDIYWLQGLTNDELSNIYKNASLLVSASIYEGFSMPPVEAVISGCPVILSNIPVHRWFWDESVKFFNTLDSEMLAYECIKLLSSESQDILKVKEKQLRQLITLYGEYENVIEFVLR